jgi:ATP-dependent DNA helicase RecG
MDIELLLTQPESKTLEFKQDISSLKPILKTITAFANTAGGLILIGYSPIRGIVGIEDVFQAEESLVSAISDSISPSLLPDIDIKTMQGKNLIIVRGAHQKGPFYIRSEGEKEGVYLRFGSSTRRASPEVLSDILRFTSNLTFDQLPCADLTINDLDQRKLHEFMSQIGKPRDQPSVLQTLGVITNRSGILTPSNGGIILFGKDQVRNHFFPDACISCARFKGLDKSHFIDRQDIEAPLYEALELILRFISRNTRLSSVIQSLQRKDIPEYPEIPLREVLVNAMVHANYALPGRIFISIFDDRLEIQNPGMLPYGITIEDFKAGISHVRNRVIARVFKELRLIEEWGSGYNRIISHCASYEYPIPEWQEFGTAMRVIFRPHPALSSHQNSVAPSSKVNAMLSSLSSRQQEIIEILSRERELKMKDILQRLKVPPAERTLRDDLAFLRAKGLIGFRGHARSATWHLLST